MSVVRMQKMSLVAHESDRSRLLKLFVKSGAVEVTRTEVIENTAYVQETERKEEYESKLLKLTFAIGFLKEMSKEYRLFDKENAPKLNFKKENRLVELDEYYETAKDEVELFAAISDMEKINSELVAIKSERARMAARIDQLLPYTDMPLRFSEIRNTEHTVMFAGLVPIEKAEALRADCAPYAETAVFGSAKQSAFVAVAHKDDAKELETALAAYDFVPCAYDYDDTASGIIAELKDRDATLELRRKEYVEQGISYKDKLTPVKVLYDYYKIEVAKADVMELCPRTGKAFVMEGWVPVDKVEPLTKDIKRKCKLTEVFFRDPADGEQPPTLLKSDPVTGAFQGITEMFGVPAYRERDPGIFVAIFYFLFFGIMISDAGYGLIMALVCFLIVKIVKPVKNSGRMLIMFGLCGISTVIWGALFGGWFSITLKEGSFLDKLSWFNPMNEPLKMFLLSLAMGVIQMATGFALKGIDEIKSKQVWSGIFNQFGWVVIFVGLALLFPTLSVFLGAINPDPVPEWIGVTGDVGMYVAIAGFAMIILGGAAGKKNPLKMVTGALGNVYGSINVVSDLLSYSRLFGLGLTTGVIGYVVNMLADLIVNTFFGGGWYGWIVAVPVLIIGHAFNLSINLLGAYVHDSRLQYIEFFGRFYEGKGHAFDPLGGKTQYTYLNN